MFSIPSGHGAERSEASEECCQAIGATLGHLERCGERIARQDPPASRTSASFERFGLPRQRRLKTEQAENLAGELLDHLVNRLRSMVEPW